MRQAPALLAELPVPFTIQPASHLQGMKHTMPMQMDEGARRWLIKQARKSLWRVASCYDLDDLIQDGYWHWCRVSQKYPHVTQRAHMMRLFQLTYINYIHDLSKRRTRLPEIPLTELTPPDMTQERYLDTIMGDDNEEAATVGALIARAPVTVKAVLRLFMTEEDREMLCRPHRRRLDHRETLNERLCRLAGYDHHKVDLVSTVRNHFAVAA